MKAPSCMRMCMVAALCALALCASSAQAKDSYVRYKAPLHSVYKALVAPTGTAIVTLYNETYATVSFDVRNVVNGYMAHIHNGTVPSHPGGVALWAFESVLPGVDGFNPISGHFSGNVAFDPQATGVAGLLEANMAYFNVHTTAYPGGALQGNFRKEL